MLQERDFDTAEDGQKYQNKGPATFVSFQYQGNKAQGLAYDFGIQRVSDNEPEVRYGPSGNTYENWCSLARRKADSRNRVIIVNCDQALLNVKFADRKFKN